MRYRVMTVLGMVVILCGIMAIAAQFGILKVQTSESFNKRNLIRLHVIANSDSPADQALKLKVRDRILKASETFLLKVQDPRQAEAILRSKLNVLASVAQDELARRDRPMPVKVQLGEFQFPRKTYSFGVLEAGEYKGLRVVIGEGKGHNWWCVLYPPLCLLSPDAPTLKKIKNRNIKVEYRLAVFEKMVKRKGLTMNQFWKRWGKTFGLF